jgi:hypothetical protein
VATILTANYETGTNGNSLAVGDAGNANGFNVVTITSPSTLTYAATPLTSVGSLSAAHFHSGGASRWEWTSASIGTRTDIYLRGYFQLSAYTSGTPQFWIGRSGTTIAFTIRIGPSSSQHLQLCDVNTVVQTSTSNIPTGTPFRVEAFVDFTNKQLTARLFLGANIEGTTADEVVQTATGLTFNSVASWNDLLIGPNTTGIFTLNSDAIAVGTGTWIGPAQGSSLTTLSAVGAIATGQTFGTTRIVRRLRATTGIATVEAFGRPTASKSLAGLTTISGAGAIGSREAFGNYYGTAVYGTAVYGPNNLTVSKASVGGKVTITGVGAIPSREAFGTPTKSPQIIRAQGIVSAQAFGTPNLIGAGAFPAIFGHLQLSDSTLFAAAADDTSPFAARTDDANIYAATLDDAMLYAEQIADDLVYAAVEDATQ